MNHKYYIIAVAATLALAGVCFDAHAIGPTPPSWEPRETVTNTRADFQSHLGSDRALAFDHHGNPAIAFFDDITARQDLRFARRVYGVWNHTTIDTAGIVGKFPSIAFDRYERPAISYYDESNGNLKYAAFDGSSWQVQTVDAIGDVGEQTSLAFDLLGHPAIAYFDVGNTDLKFVRDTDGDLRLDDEVPVTAAASLSFDTGRHASLVFDPLNRPMIAHSQTLGGGNSLGFAVEEPGLGWVNAGLDSGNTGFYRVCSIIAGNC